MATDRKLLFELHVIIQSDNNYFKCMLCDIYACLGIIKICLCIEKEILKAMVIKIKAGIEYRSWIDKEIQITPKEQMESESIAVDQQNCRQQFSKMIFHHLKCCALYLWAILVHCVMKYVKHGSWTIFTKESVPPLFSFQAREWQFSPHWAPTS